MEQRTISPTTADASADGLRDSLRDGLRKATARRLREATALALWRHGAVRVAADGAEPFRLASGNFSPIYVNCRQVISDPTFLRLFAATAGLLLEDVAFDVVAGGETAGIPYGVSLAQFLGKPAIYLRKKAKGHGIAARVEGTLAAGARVLLVEDLITDGGSKLGFLDAVAEAGATVHDALVLFDRQQGGGELLATRGVTLHAVCDRATTLAVGRDEGVIDGPAFDSVASYFADPAAWHDARGLAFRDIS
jgi:orotate phosphoribosyltransferase